MKRLGLLVGILCLTACNSTDNGKQAPSDENAAQKKENSEFESRVKLNVDDPNIGSFVKLIAAAKLMHLFEGTGPFTAFMPSNAAFAKLGDDKVQRLMLPEGRDEATALVLTHIVPGRYSAANLKSRDIASLSGKKLTINSENGVVTVNGARIIKPDDKSGPNGIVHVINGVLTP